MLYIKRFKGFQLNEAAESSYVTINTKTETLKVAALYNNNSKVGVIQLVGKDGPKNYKITMSIPLIYTGPVQPVRIYKKLIDNGASAEYTLYTNVKGQSHTLDKDEVLELVKMYNNNETVRKIGSITFTRTWKFKDEA